TASPISQTDVEVPIRTELQLAAIVVSVGLLLVNDGFSFQVGGIQGVAGEGRFHNAGVSIAIVEVEVDPALRRAVVVGVKRKAMEALLTEIVRNLSVKVSNGHNASVA